MLRQLLRWIPPSEALAVSIGEKAQVDLAYMSQLTGKTEAELTGRTDRCDI